MTSTRVTYGQLSEVRDNNFDFLRLILALVVILGHSFVLTGLTPDPISRLTSGQATAGMLAVGFFFAISGFLITKSWAGSPTLTGYLTKRALRIYPGFFVALLFCVFVVGPLADVDIHAYLRDARTYGYFGYLLFLSGGNPPNVFPHNPFPHTVNGSLWTIPCEVVFYGLVAALGLLGLFRRRAVILLLLLAVLIVYRTIAAHYPALSNMETPVFATTIIFLYFLLQFVAGMTFYLYRDAIPYSRWLLGGCGLALVATSCSGKGLLLALPLCGTYVLFFLAFSRRLPMQRFGRRGDLSYGTYLYAYPVQQLFVQWSHDRLSPLALFALAVPVTLTLAAASWHFIEKPCLRAKPKASPQPEPALETVAAA